MKTKFFITIMAFLFVSLAQATAKNIFVIDGPEDSYNQIRVVNETTQSNFTCRLVVLNNDDTTSYVYNVYNLGDRHDMDSHISRIYRGTKIAIQMPKDFPSEISFSVEYRDYPLFDAIIVHLTDGNTEFNED